MWSWREELNLRPAVYKTAALPIELRQLGEYKAIIPKDEAFNQHWIQKSIFPISPDLGHLQHDFSYAALGGFFHGQKAIQEWIAGMDERVDPDVLRF